ncbi:CDP-alcohol phosphatidyltransferase family protein [Streptosporangium sp. NPDC000239]|uniref:CDP-alcohol phosphatidyltransferase family protein n=1 Tax=Streptosporangium sp. NPDC000239 TaxID=3154248 RepID=UPI00331793CD
MPDPDASLPAEGLPPDIPSDGSTPVPAARTATVVLATTDAAGLRGQGGTLLDRLTAQLSGLPTGDVHVVTRSGDVIRAPGGAYMIGSEGSGGLADDLRRVAGVARTATGPVAVLAGNLVAHTEALALLLERPGRDTGALVTRGDGTPPVRIDRGLVSAAGTSLHDVEGPNGAFHGAFQVGADDVRTLAATAETLADLAEAGGLGTTDGAEAGELLLSGLLRSGVAVRAVGLGRLRCDRVTTQEEANAALRRLSEVDESEARLDAAIKSDDGFFATFFVSSWSGHVVRVAALLGLRPNAVTGVSVGLAVLAAVWFSAGTRPALVTGAVLVYLSFVLDCVDGQLARYTRLFSPFGAWLDATFDRVKEYVVYLGLALGYQGEGIWPLTVGALILQTLRHTVDFSYVGARADAERAGHAWAGAAGSPAARSDVAVAVEGPRRRGRDPYGPVATPAEPPVPPAPPASQVPQEPPARRGNAVVRLSHRLEQDSLTRWLKKIIVLPIGERMALIAVTAALFDARVTFLALLGWGCVAMLYTLSGRVARSMSR